MVVYVESNFVLEHALQQEQSESCEELIRIASVGSIHLVIPAFSLAEPHLALSSKVKVRSKLGNDLLAQLSELGRSKPFREAPGTFGELVSFLTGSAERELEGLQLAIRRLLKTASVVPLDSMILHRAGEIQTSAGMSAQDSIVFASILSHLADTKPRQSCFLNRNTKDFDDPNVRELLNNLGCKFFGRFDDGLHYIESRLRETKV